jgi:Carboxypeptidase regulatory-like domain/TonB dependent receptor
MILRISGIILLAILSAAAIPAQSTFGSFIGTVRDPSGSVIGACKVTAINKGTDLRRSSITDSTGGYDIVNLEPGTYQLEVEAPGFQRGVYPNLELQSRQTIRIDANLLLATQTNTVNVSQIYEAPINTEVSNIAETKLGRELTDLPIAIGSRGAGSTSAFTTLTTQPGVVVDASGNLSVAGSKPSMLSVSIDGISSMSPRNSAPISELFPSFDGIAEIRVSEINNSAEFGGVSDITTISKSGTNAFHGGAYENNQNTAFNARNTFSATVPKLDMNDFGGFGGGPVIIPKLYNGKDKTFFFASYEALRLPSQQVLVQSVPSLALRTGDLSVYTTPVLDPLAGTPFPGNQIPVSRIAPLSSKALQSLFPLPNTGSPNAIANNYVTNFPTPISSNQGDIRGDQKITANQSVFARFTYKAKLANLTPTGSALLGGFVRPENDDSLAGAHNWIINPHLVNEVRGGYSRSNLSTSYGITAQQNADQLGLTPYLPQAPPAGNAVANFRISGFQSTGGSASSISQTSTYQVLDNLTWSKGRHTVKTGGDYRYLKALYTNVFASQRLGSYAFNNSVTKSTIGNSYAAFLLGYPDSDSIATVLNPDTDGYGSSYAFFAQDDFRITPRLTINYGLRWEYHPMFQDHNSNTANFLPDYVSVQNGVSLRGAVVVPDKGMSLINPAFAASIAPTPILSATAAGVPQSLRYSSKRDFAPRIGFAYRATADGKTVIRGGYGKFIEAQLGNLLLSSWAVEASNVASFTNQIVGGKPVLSFPYPFPSNLSQPGSQVFDLSNVLHYEDPFVQQWNLTVERDLGYQTGLRVSYDGSHGRNLGLTDNPNQVAGNTVGYAVASKTAPFPLFNQIIEERNGGVSNYNALTVAVNKRMSHGLQFQVSYNYAKNLSNIGGYSPTSFAGSGGGTISDRFNTLLDYGNVAYTRRNRFQTTFLYESPFGRTSHKVVNLLAGGWELAGVLMFQDGPFLTVLANGADPSGTNFVNLNGNGRADIISGASIIPATQSIAQWINPAAFAIPANNIGRYGSSPVGSVIGPGTQAVSLSLFRSFKVTERAQIRIGMAVANAFNHPNYGTPGLTLGTAAFGTISTLQSAEGAGPRSLQLSGRITF